MEGAGDRAGPDAEAVPAGTRRAATPISCRRARSPAAFAGSDVVVHAAGLVRAARSDDLQRVNVGGTRAGRRGRQRRRRPARASLESGRDRARHAPHGRRAKTILRSRSTPTVAASSPAKRSCERQRTVPWIILRPSAVYGPGDRGVPAARPAGQARALPADRSRSNALHVHLCRRRDRCDCSRALSARYDGEALFIGHPHAETAASLLRGLATESRKRYRPVVDPWPSRQARRWSR